jgi:hypothetical protein
MGDIGASIRRRVPVRILLLVCLASCATPAPESLGPVPSATRGKPLDAELTGEAMRALAISLQIPVGLLDVQKSVQIDARHFVLVKSTKGVAAFAVLAEENGKWLVEGVVDEPWSGPSTAPLALIRAPERTPGGSTFVLGGFVAEYITRLETHTVDGRLLDTDEADSGAVLIQAADGVQIRAFAQDGLIFAAPVTEEPIQPGSSVHLPGAARKVADDFVATLLEEVSAPPSVLPVSEGGASSLAILLRQLVAELGLVEQAAVHRTPQGFVYELEDATRTESYALEVWTLRTPPWRVVYYNLARL